ncbi:hypothetical protein PSP6_160060 [Paraburkholderia tropica]|nr:hypothetical protein PSP6_160060 [Paraburkholderia tropica]
MSVQVIEFIGGFVLSDGGEKNDSMLKHAREGKGGAASRRSRKREELIHSCCTARAVRGNVRS